MLKLGPKPFYPLKTPVFAYMVDIYNEKLTHGPQKCYEFYMEKTGKTRELQSFTHTRVHIKNGVRKRLRTPPNVRFYNNLLEDFLYLREDFRKYFFVLYGGACRRDIQLNERLGA